MQLMTFAGGYWAHDEVRIFAWPTKGGHALTGRKDCLGIHGTPNGMLASSRNVCSCTVERHVMRQLNKVLESPLATLDDRKATVPRAGINAGTVTAREKQDDITSQRLDSETM
mmetsp:Transcript_31313/g.46705  ORF Transcript_31313/g.46705 Transcript_31313/m.46705 type:complete len:113 (-) Transcript_31313:37-375(-)